MVFAKRVHGVPKIVWKNWDCLKNPVIVSQTAMTTIMTIKLSSTAWPFLFLNLKALPLAHQEEAKLRRWKKNRGPFQFAVQFLPQGRGSRYRRSQVCFWRPLLQEVGR